MFYFSPSSLQFGRKKKKFRQKALAASSKHESGKNGEVAKTTIEYDVCGTFPYRLS